MQTERPAQDEEPRPEEEVLHAIVDWWNDKYRNFTNRELIDEAERVLNHAHRWSCFWGSGRTPREEPSR